MYLSVKQNLPLWTFILPPASLTFFSNSIISWIDKFGNEINGKSNTCNIKHVVKIEAGFILHMLGGRHSLPFRSCDVSHCWRFRVFSPHFGPVRAAAPSTRRDTPSSSSPSFPPPLTPGAACNQAVVEWDTRAWLAPPGPRWVSEGPPYTQPLAMPWLF